ncbi:MAG: hypothetical protein ABI388_01005 [Bacteroidia bacterium]
MQNSQLKFWKWTVILLAVLNIVLLTSIWLKKDKSNEMQRPPNGEKAADFLIEQLKFSTQQQTDFSKLKQIHRHAVDSIRESGKEIHRLFFDNLKNEKADTVEVHKLARAIADNQTQIEIITFTHFEQVRKLCNEQQKIKFDEIIQEVLRKMAGQNRRGPPPSPNN